MNQHSSNPDNSSAGASRRDFLKTSSALAASAALAGSLSLTRSAHAAGNDLVKIALIGCGGRGTGACQQALSTSGPIKLVAMADAFADRLAQSHRQLTQSHADKVDVPEERRFIGFDAYQKALDAGIDVVLLATPPGFRPIHFEAAVRAGKHVFMEKPVATDALGVHRVIATAAEAKQKNLKVGVGLQRHHEAKYVETVKRLHDGAIGDILSMRIYWNGGAVPLFRVFPRDKLRQDAPELTEMEYQMRNWYNFVWTCGDHIVEQHVHNIDVAHWVKNALPVRANGMGGYVGTRSKDHGEIYNHHAVEFEYADGSRVLSQCRRITGQSYDCWNLVAEFAQGTKGTANLQGPAFTIDSTGGKKWKSAGKGKNPYQVEHDDLFAAIRRNEPYNEAEFGAMSTMMAIMGRMCTYSGKVLTWDEAFNSQVSVMPKEYSWQATPPTLPDADGWYAMAQPGKTRVV
jgi:predicted dehydrogenase